MRVRVAYEHASIPGSCKLLSPDDMARKYAKMSKGWYQPTLRLVGCTSLQCKIEYGMDALIHLSLARVFQPMMRVLENIYRIMEKCVFRVAQSCRDLRAYNANYGKGLRVRIHPSLSELLSSDDTAEKHRDDEEMATKPTLRVVTLPDARACTVS